MGAAPLATVLPAGGQDVPGVGLVRRHDAVKVKGLVVIRRVSVQAGGWHVMAADTPWQGGSPHRNT